MEPIPARTVTISPQAVAATDAALGKLWHKGLRPTPAQRLRIKSIIQSVIDELQDMGLFDGT